MSDLPPRRSRGSPPTTASSPPPRCTRTGSARTTVERLVAAGVLRAVAQGVFVDRRRRRRTLEQRCAVLVRRPPRRVRHRADRRLAGRAPPHAATGRRCTSPCATASTSPTARACAGARPRRSGPPTARPRRRHRRRRRGRGWRSTSPPTCGRSITSRSSTSCSTTGTSPSTSSSRSTRRLGHPARPGSGRVPPHARVARRHGRRSESHPEVVLADALRRRGVPVEPPGRAVVRPRRAARSTSTSPCPRVRWGVELDIHPEHRIVRGPRRRRRAAARAAPRWRGRSRRSASTTCARSERLADELAVLYRLRCRRARRPSECGVRAGPPARTRMARRHSDGGGRQMVGTSVWRPKTSARAVMISPRVAYALTASMSTGIRLRSGSAAAVAQRRRARRRPRPGRGRGGPGRGA